jgi:hypothetical protein
MAGLRDVLREISSRPAACDQRGLAFQALKLGAIQASTSSLNSVAIFTISSASLSVVTQARV